MGYKKGQVVLISRIKFADNGQYDHAASRPTLIPIASDDYTGETYYLTLTHNIGRINICPEQYYDLSENWREAHLLKPSLINLENIYVGQITGEVKGGLSPQMIRDVIRELKEYQEKHPCDNYEKIKGKL